MSTDKDRSPLSDHDNDTEAQSISKSQVKRELKEIRSLGARLMELNTEQANLLPLSDRLRTALEESKKIKSFNARKRHLGFIGRLLRDQPLEPIQDYFDYKDGLKSSRDALFHNLENLRDRMVSGDHNAITEFISEYPDADRQYLNQLVRNAVKEKQAEKPPANYRRLFRYLREISEKSTR